MTLTRSSLALSLAAVLVACGTETADAGTPTPNVVQLAQGNPDLSILVEAVVAADLAATLSAPGPYTVFAPTNAAFAALLTELGVTKAQLLADKPLLTAVLQYHVLGARVAKAQIPLGKAITPLAGGIFKIDMVGADVVITDGRNRTAKIVATDIPASNALVHVVDKVILPADKNIVQTAQALPDFSILVEAVVAADLAGTLSGPGPFTVFAPTNAAFAALLDRAGRHQGRPARQQAAPHRGAHLPRARRPGAQGRRRPRHPAEHRAGGELLHQPRARHHRPPGPHLEHRRHRRPDLERRHPRHRPGHPPGPVATAGSTSGGPAHRFVRSSGPLAHGGRPSYTSPPMSTVESSLLARASHGEDAAVRECMSRFGPIVWGLARRMSPTRADAEDAVQEIFLDLWEHGARYDALRGSEEAFVAVVARRRLIDRRRKVQRRPVTDSFDAAPGGREVLQEGSHDGGIETSAEAAMAARAMTGLRPEQREVLRLSVAEGLTHDEIAEHTGMPVGTVKAHARRGLIRIRKLLLGEDTGERNVEEDAG